jgi:hypothetical protein
MYGFNDFESKFNLACACNAIHVFTWLYTYIRSRDLRKTPEQNEKMDELKMNIAKGCYYCAVSLAQATALANYPWLPTVLGGQGQINSPLPANTYPNYPRDSDTDMLKRVFYLQIFYHCFASAVSAMPGNRVKPETFFHHAVTMCLMGAALYTDQVLQGVTVLLLHDSPDVLVCVVKTFHSLSLIAPTVISFVCMLCAYSYFRLYLFSRFAWGILMNSGSRGNAVWGVLLYALVGLYVWWFYLYVRMGMRFAFGRGPPPTTSASAPGNGNGSGNGNAHTESESKKVS